jgi:hypothetical protein
MKNNSMITGGSSALVAILFSTALQAQNVGIGVSSPQSKLSVNGTTSSGGLAIGDSTYTSTSGTVAPTNGAIIQGNTGIGTKAPQALLHVVDGGLVRSNSNGTASATINTDGGVRLYRNPATASYIGGYLDMGVTSSPTFVGRIFSYTGAAGQPAPFTVGSGLGLSTNVSNSFPDLLIDASTGNVGINALTPTEAKLVVRGSVTGNVGANAFFSSGSTTLGAGAASQGNFSIYASNAIVAGGSIVSGNSIVAASSITPSDIRLKNVVGASDTATDLKTLEKIQITDYTMKDPMVFGTGVLKKVIAQQVEEVYPRAVTKRTDYLPDIYAFGEAQGQADGLFEIRLAVPHRLKAGDKIKVFTRPGEAEFVTVKTASEKSFTAKLNMAANGIKVFVYGRQVNDLRAVDYDAIAMLNVSATQELAKKAVAQDARIAALEAENTKLKVQAHELTDLKAENAELAARMAALEKAVARSEIAGVRTVASNH